MKKIQIPSQRGRSKPLEICEFDNKRTPASGGNFHLGDAEMKKVADKTAKSLAKKQDAPRW